MIPEAARVAKSIIRIDDTGRMMWHDLPVVLHKRYATNYLEVMVGSCLYLLPAPAFAWFLHTGRWTDKRVAPRDANPLNFHKDNLREREGVGAKVIFKKRLTREEAKNYTGVRASKG